MCGVLVVVQKSGAPLNASACRRALSHLSWRGPDLSVSSIWNDRVFIGHNVLSLTGEVRDRRSGYLKSRSGRYAIAFNGEIYNFRELAKQWLPDQFELNHNTSDTEVLVNLHDVIPVKDVPVLLDGMYAYTILDEYEGVVYTVRDVQGEKSLFVYEDEQVIVIASEISSIKSLVPTIPLDRQALRDYFRTRHFMLFSRTAYLGIRQILPGSVEQLIVQDNVWKQVAHRTIGDWINPTLIEANHSRDADSLADELDALLIRSVKEMLPVGWPYAAVVTGGVDSSLLSHYLVTYGDPKTLVAVNNVGKDWISSDLSGFEQTLGRKIDVLKIEKAGYAAEVVRCQATCGSPLMAHSFVTQSIQSAYVQSTGCRVLFGGEGGDEYFGGYDAYLKDVTTDSLYSPSPYLTNVTPEVTFIDDDSSALQSDLQSAWKASLQAYNFLSPAPLNASLAMMYGDAAYQLPAVGLRCADLMSMMWSVEARSVLLRKPIVSFALNLPLQMRTDRTARSPNLRTKVLLKKLFSRYYPESLLVKKQGFSGFPNESADYLGSLEDYMVFETLDIRRPHSFNQFSRATLWKLANLEYFLRSCSF